MQYCRSSIEEEISSVFDENLSVVKKNKRQKLPIWFVANSSTSLRLNDLGFEVYSKLYKPYSLEFRMTLTSKMLLELDSVLQLRPWHYQRKYRPKVNSSHPPMANIVYHWSEELNVSWILSGEDWNTWIIMNH